LESVRKPSRPSSSRSVRPMSRRRGSLAVLVSVFRSARTYVSSLPHPPSPRPLLTHSCEQLIELMGGTISLASEYGHGTTLTAELKMQKAALEAPVRSLRPLFPFFRSRLICNRLRSLRRLRLLVTRSSASRLTSSLSTITGSTGASYLAS
jgi:hypothetical protein